MSSTVLKFLLPFEYCDTCSRRGVSKKDMKRCQGCNSVVYCNKECQKAAWPTHKLLCRQRPPSLTELGFPNQLLLAHCVREWADVHCMTLSTIAHAMTYLVGGCDSVIQSGQCVGFDLSPNERITNNTNPAAAFQIMKIFIVDKRAHEEALYGEPLSSSASQPLPNGLPAPAPPPNAQRGQPEADDGPYGDFRFVPVTFTLNMRIPAVSYGYYIRRLTGNIRHVADDHTNPRTVAAFKDFCMMLTFIVRHGHVLRPCSPEIQSPTRPLHLPCVGILQRPQGRRAWRWVLTSWDWSTALRRRDETEGHDLGPRELMTMFQVALSQRDIDSLSRNYLIRV